MRLIESTYHLPLRFQNLSPHGDGAQWFGCRVPSGLGAGGPTYRIAQPQRASSRPALLRLKPAMRCHLRLKLRLQPQALLGEVAVLGAAA